VLYREAGQFKTNYAADMAIFPIRQDRIGVALLLIVAFVVVPLMDVFHIPPFQGEYLMRAILLPFLILALAAIGLNILVGYCGQLSLGSGAFMAIGAYFSYKFATGAFYLPPLPIVLSILLGGLVAAIIGVLFGIPSLRIKGLYLAVATLAAQFFFDWVFLRVKWFTNYAPSGSASAPDLIFFGYKVSTPTEKYLLALAFLTIFALAAKNLVRGNLGRQWMAIRDMDIAAELIGIRPLVAKLSAFAISSFVLGVAGALWAFVYLGTWEPLAFSIDRSLQLLFMVIIGGLGSILGAILGAAFILILPIMLNQIPAALGVPISTATGSHLESIIFGSLICYLLIKEPLGFARLWQIAKEKLRLWPFPY
jgi:branched-chain amino acid transport system permease protein